jgi:hypothetical protein
MALAAGCLSLAAGLLQSFSVSLIGKMPLAELIFLLVGCVALVAFCMDPRAINLLPAPRLFLFLLVCQAVSFGGYILADLYRMSDTRDLLRGWARLVFLGVDIVAVAALFGTSPRSFLLYQLGYAIGYVACTVVLGPHLNELWKFGYAVPAVLGALLVTPFLGFWTVEMALVGMGILNLSLDYRSMGGACLLVACLLVVARLPQRIRPWALPAGAVAAALAALALYSYSGPKASKRATQSNVERTAMISAAWLAIVDSPVIGQGSWFSRSKVLDTFFLLRYQGTQLSGGKGVERTGDTDAVAIHSQILVSFAEGGIFGGCFFVAYGGLLVWAIWYGAAVQRGNRFAGLYLLVLTCAFWDLWMSPFSGQARGSIAAAVGVILLFWEEHSRTRGSAEAPAQARRLTFTKRGLPA